MENVIEKNRFSLATKPSAWSTIGKEPKIER